MDKDSHIFELAVGRQNQTTKLSAETKKLESIYQQKINDLEELKKSILQKAFAGSCKAPKGQNTLAMRQTPIAKKKTITSPERA